MKKLLLLLVAAFVALGGLWACTAKSPTNIIEEEVVEDIVLNHTVEDEILLVDLANVDIANKTITLEDGTGATLLSDIDLTNSGAQTLKLRYTDSTGKEVVVEKIVYIAEKNVLEETSKDQDKLKELIKAPTSVINPQEDNYVVEIPEDEAIENKGETSNPQGEVVESKKTETSTTNTTSTNSGSNNNSNDGSYSVSYSEGGSSQFPDAQAFVDWLNSTYGPQSCNTAVNMWYSQMGGRSGLNGYETASPQYGDKIIYYDANGNYMHTAIYLGNGMAMHGNYTSNGTAKIASINLYSSHKYFHYDSNGNQEVDLYGQIVESQYSKPSEAKSQQEAIDSNNQAHMNQGDSIWYNPADGQVYYDDEKISAEEYKQRREEGLTTEMIQNGYESVDELLEAQHQWVEETGYDVDYCLDPNISFEEFKAHGC